MKKAKQHGMVIAVVIGIATAGLLAALCLAIASSLTLQGKIGETSLPVVMFAVMVIATTAGGMSAVGMIEKSRILASLMTSAGIGILILVLGALVFEGPFARVGMGMGSVVTGTILPIYLSLKGRNRTQKKNRHSR